MSFTNFLVEIDGDGIAVVTWDEPGRSMNVIDAAVMDELSTIVEQTTADAAVKGVVITSAKDAFCAGADLTMLEGLSRTFAELIDAVVPKGDLVKTAKDWIKAGGSAKAPWDVDGFKLPGGPVYSKAGVMVFTPANAIYRRETYDNYPAARAILQVVYEGLQLPMDQALRVESRWFAKILRSPEAAAMIRTLFVSMQELNKGARRPKGVLPTQLRSEERR